MTLLCLTLLITLSACSDSTVEKEAQKPPTTGEIVERYVDTLTGAQDKARDAARAVEKKDAATTEEIEEDARQ